MDWQSEGFVLLAKELSANDVYNSDQHLEIGMEMNDSDNSETHERGNLGFDHLPPINQITPPVKPEISIVCMKCEEEIKVRHLKEHQEFHNALEMFRFTMDRKPSSVKQLIRRRRAILRRLNETASSENPVSMKKLQKLNLAYEAIKADIEGTNTTLRNVDEFFLDQRNIQGRGTTLTCALAFGVCQHANSRWKTSMEDRYAFKDFFCNDPQSGFFAIYDGYSGSMAAEKCARYLSELLENKVESIYQTSMKHEDVNEEIVVAFNQAFEEMDRILLYGVEEQSRNRWSGCSALTCLLRGNNLYVANAGNIRAVLCRGDGSIERLSDNHSPWDKKERHRIRKAKGDVSKSDKTALVNGVVKSTRGLGNHGDPNLKTSVIRTPFVNCLTLEDADQFLILASNGVWEVFSEEEVILLLEDIIPDIDVRAIVRRMQDRASALEVGLPVPKWDEIPRRSKGVASPEGNKSAEAVSSTEQMSQGDIVNKDTYSDNEEDNSSESPTEMDEDKPITKSPVLLQPPAPSLRSQGSTLQRNEKACALAKALSERLVEGAILAGSRDNITVAVVLLNGCPLQLFFLPKI
ncbi:probable protein phosphatase 2C 69 [Orbicella faveolata]|uniref:probable protein phosphatase 2C 69 n=1 Tax=Orbicella faveolata TaxID=48498 RepID=UPI0009E53E49|nr:probable protein phosphatase 2C 69 [Orbicella faveolata]